MAMARRVYISVPGDSVLSEPQQTLKWAIIVKITVAGYVPEFFYSERPHAGSLTHGVSWSFGECSKLMRRCVFGGRPIPAPH